MVNLNKKDTMGFLDFIFGSKNNELDEFLTSDAIILDVRTQSEWDTGHIDNAVHIPLNELPKRIGEISKHNKPVITCCASGIRSAKASQILKQNHIKAINGGSWKGLKSKL